MRLTAADDHPYTSPSSLILSRENSTKHDKAQDYLDEDLSRTDRRWPLTEDGIERREVLACLRRWVGGSVP
ncbi:MAG TPA: hypothetical protein VG013_29875 [Gemmataceae bacterium]|nr:hypothetical protein [Gemmataceae bacterium]